MFNEEEWLMAIEDAKKENEYYVFDIYKCYIAYTRDGHIDFSASTNTQYVLTLNGYVENSDNNASLRPGFIYSDGTKSEWSFNSLTEETKNYISKQDKSISHLFISYGTTGTAYIHHIQLEEGDTATEYEPYYITKNTKVVQRQNHTLTAIWKENT